MKHFNMKQRKGKLVPVPPQKKSRPSEAAFDVWLQRGLHQLFDDVAREPVPEEFLRLIEEDRKVRAGRQAGAADRSAQHQGSQEDREA